MKIFKIVLAAVMAYMVLAAFTIALCRLLERLMAKEYSVAAGIYSGRSHADAETASRRICVYKKLLTPAYMVKDILRADQASNVIIRPQEQEPEQ